MNKATISQIESKIDMCVDNMLMFTAYDITKSLRHDGLMTFHDDVKEFIRNTFDEDDYKKIWNPLIKAFVYHPKNTDVSLYNKDAVPEFIINNNSMYRSRGRFTIKKEYVETAGFQPNQKVYIEYGTNQLVISNDDNCHEISVDKYGNISLSKSILEHAFGIDYQRKSLSVKNIGNNIQIDC